tara:strand:+ start:4266 stop:4946 length:681 start_codon:yes stop_codon:yes gene_type:complete
MLQLIDKGKIYFYVIILFILLSIHNKNSIYYFSNFFKIQRIILNSDLDENYNKEIINSLNKYYNFNIYTINQDDLIETFDKYNLINEFSVKKVYPSSIQIHLKKTNLLASFIENNQKIYLGENGKKIKKKLDNNDLPKIFGKFKIDEFFNLRNQLIKNGFNISNFNKFYCFKSNRWDLVYKDQLLIRLPISEIDLSISKLKTFIEDPNLKNIKTIDMRIKNKIIIS